jgi:hypothetical protein
MVGDQHLILNANAESLSRKVDTGLDLLRLVHRPIHARLIGREMSGHRIGECDVRCIAAVLGPSKRIYTYTARFVSVLTCRHAGLESRGSNVRECHVVLAVRRYCSQLLPDS